MRPLRAALLAILSTMTVLQTVNAGSTAPSFNESPPTVTEQPETDSGAKDQGVNPAEPAQINNSLSAPELLLSTDGNLDIGKLATNASFKVAYPSFGLGHKVTLRWAGATTYNTPIQTTASTSPLTFSVPKTTVAQDFAGSATVTYTVEVPGAPPQTSQALTVKVMIEDLAAPVLPLAESGRLDIGKAPLSVPFTVAYPSLAAAQKITLNWGGATPYKTAAQNTTSTLPLTFNIPREIIAKDFGSTVPVTYTVEIPGVPALTSEPINIQVILGSFPPPGLPLLTGVETAINLNNRYNDTRDICEDGKPAYDCDGVLIRATENGNFDPWNPSNSAITLGGVSFSYMRKDAFVTTVYRNSGFTFFAQQDAIKQNKEVDYLCIYPYDAWTAQPRRPDAGCGFQPKSAQSSTDLSTCVQVNAETVEGWYAFTSTLTRQQDQCSLSTQDPGQFATSLKVRAKRPANMPDAWNEILAKVWEQNIPGQLPLESFFYKNAAGLAEAKAYQQKYAARTGGGWLPIIKLDLTNMNSTPFSYTPADQAIQP